MDKRNNSSSSVLSFTLLLFFFSSASAFNITRLLNQFPEFGAFNDYLTKTQLYKQINSRQTITILALDNATVSAVAGNSLEIIKEILSVHVVLDYYDIEKLRKLSTDKTTVLTTMFQSTGDAVNQQGFLKLVLNNKGQIEFGSAGKSAPLNAKLIKAVAAQPYNISVLQISAPIIIPGIGVYPSPPPPAPFVPPPTAVTPAPTPVDGDDDADSPADAPDADTPSPSPSAEAPGSPASSPPKPADDGADAPSTDDDNDGHPPNSGSGVGVGAGVVMGLGLLSLVF